MKLPVAQTFVAALVFWSFNAIAGERVDPSAALRTAVQQFTSTEILKVEKSRDGLKSTYEIDFQPASLAVTDLELTRSDFKLIEAEGKIQDAATDFNPGPGLKPLAELHGALKNHPQFRGEEWNLEKNWKGAWVYKVSGRQGADEYDYIFDAETLALLKSKKD